MSKSTLPTIFRVKCKYADKYKAKREPTCGCQVCATKWEEAETMRYFVKKGKEAAKNARQQDALWREC